MVLEPSLRLLVILYLLLLDHEVVLQALLSGLSLNGPLCSRLFRLSLNGFLWIRISSMEGGINGRGR